MVTTLKTILHQCNVTVTLTVFCPMAYGNPRPSVLNPQSSFIGPQSGVAHIKSETMHLCCRNAKNQETQFRAFLDTQVSLAPTHVRCPSVRMSHFQISMSASLDRIRASAETCDLIPGETRANCFRKVREQNLILVQ